MDPDIKTRRTASSWSEALCDMFLLNEILTKWLKDRYFFQQQFEAPTRATESVIIWDLETVPDLRAFTAANEPDGSSLHAKLACASPSHRYGLFTMRLHPNDAARLPIAI